MNKEKLYKFGKNIYLLGRRKEDNKKVYLEDASWDCGWYWGFGYLETYTNENIEIARDIQTHSHFDTDILKGKSHGFDNFKEYFSETPLSDDEIWEICDYMQTFYTLRETAEIFGRGYSHFTEAAKIDKLKIDEYVENINKNLLPLLFDKIRNILTPKNN